MTKHRCIWFFIWVSLPFLANGQTVPEINFEDFYCKISFQEQEHHRQSHSHTVVRAYTPMNNYDLKYHRLYWSLDPAVHYIRGSVTSYFEPTEDQVQTIWMQLSDSLRVDSIQYRGRKIPFIHSPGDWLGIYFPDPLVKEQLDSITVHYQGAPPDGGRSFEQDSHDGNPIIWTLSQPYGARDWWPCKQTLDDKIDSIDVWLDVPEGNTAVSNGLRLSQTTQNGRTLFHYQHRYPIPAYLIAIAITNYLQVDHYYVSEGPNGLDSIPFINYIYPEDSSVYSWQSRRAVEAMAVFDSLIGPYPFKDELYGHAQFGWGGGMEHQTMSFMFNFDWALVVHELAHAWAGNKVTCGSWQDIWLNEGLTDYLTGMSYETLFDGRFWPIFKQSHLERILREPDGSVYIPEEDTLDVTRTFNNRLTYRKGAMVAHVLRWTLGDSAFFAGLKSYFNDPELAFGYALTPDFQRHMEAAGDTVLEEFFRDWVYGEGHPIYRINTEQQGDSLMIELNQRSSHPSVSFFEVDVPIYLYWQDGDSTLLRLRHEQSSQRFMVPLSKPLMDLAFDPEIWLIAELDSQGSTHIQGVEYDFELYPQPAMEQIYVRIGQKNFETQSIGVYDLTGRPLLEPIFIHSNSEPYALDLGKLASGIYLIGINTSKGSFYQKFIKQ